MKGALFTAEIEPALANAQGRFPRPRPETAARRRVCAVRALSRNVLTLDTFEPLRHGAMLWLTLPGMAPALGSVVWAEDLAAGCLLGKPLSRDQYDRLNKLAEAPTAEAR
ncbi:MAG: hypothetical protein A4S12_02370 [Proteobacteria bacterium SG_bin5]|nr:MAG: hypothetical protein A4S12_02370 [Proteobacteria bacterium SG_bin5]